MDLKLVEYLMLACETGSFAKAAAKVGIAQPSFGRQIEKLEQECGTKLLHRHGRGVNLTPEGERFVAGIRPVLHQVEQLRGALQKERLPRGDVTVGMTPTMHDLFGLELVLAVRRKFPEINLNIISAYSGYVHEWLIDGTLDIALLHDARRSRQIIVDFLANAGLYLISPVALSKDAPYRDHAELSELARLPLVLPTRKHGLRRTLETACAEHGITMNIVYEMDALALMKELIVAGEAHTVFAIPAVQHELAAGLVTARVLRPRLETRVVVATAYKRSQTRAMQAVQASISEVLKLAVDQATMPMDVQY